MKMKLPVLALILLCWSQGIYSQVITAGPVFPVDSEPVVITFHADQGDMGLKDYPGDDIYAYTGVITDKSSGAWAYVLQSSWTDFVPKAKLTKVSANVYTLSITPSIREYYNVPAGEKILKMAFVFRNTSLSNTKSGRDTGGNDIFYNVSEEASFELLLSQPALHTSLVSPGENITVQASASVCDSIVLYRNGIPVTRVTVTTLNHAFTAPASGGSKLVVKAWHNNISKSDSAYFFVRTAPAVEAVPEGLEPGINILDDNRAAFVLFAPDKNNVFLLGDFNNWAHSSEGFMKRSPDGSKYWIEVTGLEPDKEYGFQYLIDETLRIPDPYSTKVLDPWNDRNIDESTYPGLKPYPDGLADNLVSVFQTRPPVYTWETDNFTVPSRDTLIIYEMLVRDFVEKHDFKTIRDSLDYFTRLGVNAIELMPVNEFEGNSSWGYNPSMYFAVDKYYGPADDLKELIDSCHSRGIAVIMDIVLNHAYGTNPLVRMYWNNGAGQPASDNPWFNVTSPNTAFSWGYDFNHESIQTRAFVDSVCHYWINEFRVDGFRFDFTKGFTNTPGDGWAYDASRIAILNRIGNRIRSYKTDAILILEHFADNNEEKELASAGFLLWGSAKFRYQAASTSLNSGGWNMSLAEASWLNRGWNGPGFVDYMESHDEERIMYLNRNRGESSGNYMIRDLNTALDRVKLTAAFFMSIPGPKMLWQFQELGYDYSIDFNDRLGPKPVRWDYYNDEARKNLFDIFSALAELKKSYPAFSSDNFSIYESGETKRLNIRHQDMDVVVLGNFDLLPRTIDPNFTGTGTWYEFFSGSRADVTETGRNTPVSLKQGEYRLYTSKQVERPSFLTGIEDLPATEKPSTTEFEVYPNPFSDLVRICFDNSKKPWPHRIDLFSADGAGIRTMMVPEGINEVTIEAANLPAGMYFVKVTSERASTVKKVIKY